MGSAAFGLWNFGSPYDIPRVVELSVMWSKSVGGKGRRNSWCTVGRDGSWQTSLGSVHGLRDRGDRLRLLEGNRSGADEGRVATRHRRRHLGNVEARWVRSGHRIDLLETARAAWGLAITVSSRGNGSGSESTSTNCESSVGGTGLLVFLLFVLLAAPSPAPTTA